MNGMFNFCLRQATTNNQPQASCKGNSKEDVINILMHSHAENSNHNQFVAVNIYNYIHVKYDAEKASCLAAVRYKFIDFFLVYILLLFIFNNFLISTFVVTDVIAEIFCKRNSNHFTQFC